MATLADDGSPLTTVRRAPKLSGLALFVVSFQTLGIIYSDIGTSPLYVLNGIWPASGPAPSEEDVVGGISAIIWSLTLLPLLKYVFIALRFGTSEGEGGTFALFHGLYPPKVSGIDAYRTLTGDTVVPENPPSQSSRRRSFMQAIRWPLLIWALFGTSLTMADGILTPAVSVVSAVVGIAVAKPSVTDDVVGISIAFLVGLFLVQRIGTSRLAFLFAPVTFIWFALLAVTGIVNITEHPGIFRAFDPSRAVALFVRTGNYDLLAGVLLAVTGCEAMFANLGQFNVLSIQIAFSSIVYPALVLAYLGQGARLIVDGEAVLPNVFYQTIPGNTNGPLYWIFFVFAIMATLIASQALISATFSLVQQVVNMSSLPPFRLIYTSETIQGQIYVPIVNWILMIATIIFVVGFGTSANLTNAYGFAVATVMFTTTVLITFQIRIVKHKPYIIAVAFFIPFAFFDGLFWGASLRKVPHGAWVPLMVGLILVVGMTFWTWAKGLEDKFDGNNRKNLRLFISDEGVRKGHAVSTQDSTGNSIEQGNDEYIPNLFYTVPSQAGHSMEKALDSYDGFEEKRELMRIQTCAVFHKLTPGQGVPHTFVGFIRQWPALPHVVIFLSVRVLPVARVSVEDRYQVSKVRSLPGFYGATYCLGFRDDFEVKVVEVIDQICKLETYSDPTGASASIRQIRTAAKTSTHIVPHYHVVSRHVHSGKIGLAVSWIRKLLIEEIYRPMASLFPETANWLGSADEIIHVGINAVI